MEGWRGKRAVALIGILLFWVAVGEEAAIKTAKAAAEGCCATNAAFCSVDDYPSKRDTFATFSPLEKSGVPCVRRRKKEVSAFAWFKNDVSYRIFPMSLWNLAEMVVVNDFNRSDGLNDPCGGAADICQGLMDPETTSQKKYKNTT